MDDGTCVMPLPYYNLNIWLVNNTNTAAIDVSGHGQAINASLYTPPAVWTNSGFEALYITSGARFELPQTGILNMSSPDTTFSIQQGANLSGSFIASITHTGFPTGTFNYATSSYPIGLATDNINLATLKVNGMPVDYSTYSGSNIHWSQNPSVAQYKTTAGNVLAVALDLYSTYGTTANDIAPQGTYSGWGQSWLDNVQPSYMVQVGSLYDNRVTDITTFSNGYDYISHVIGTENTSTSVWPDDIDLEFHLDSSTTMPGNDVNIFIDISQDINPLTP